MGSISGTDLHKGAVRPTATSIIGLSYKRGFDSPAGSTNEAYCNWPPAIRPESTQLGGIH